MRILGCIADDITGATDVASAIARAGSATALFFGVPAEDEPIPHGCEAVVIALKSRTSPSAEAVEDSLAAQTWLMRQGFPTLYFKYCSTFDSTPEGNIGPVSEALMERAGSPLVIHAPGYPENGRTVYQGHLFVGSVPLSESSMRDHPLTPMTDSNLQRVLAAQSRAPVRVLPIGVIAQGAEAISDGLSTARAGDAGHVIADTIAPDDLVALADATVDQPLLAGGAAFAGAVTRSRRHRDVSPHPLGAGDSSATPAAVLAGSASTATAAQIDDFAERWPALRLEMDALMRQDVVADILAWAEERLPHGPVLIAPRSDQESVQRAHDRYGRDVAAARIEEVLAEVARTLVASGLRRLIVAGGETSGAVAAALGLTSVLVGEDIARGVPWVYAPERDLALAFKSGNFGGPRFFREALGEPAGDGAGDA